MSITFSYVNSGFFEAINKDRTRKTATYEISRLYKIFVGGIKMSICKNYFNFEDSSITKLSKGEQLWIKTY